MFARSATHATSARRLRRVGRVRAPARGFILGYILFSLIVLGIVVAALSRLNESEAETKWVNEGVVSIKEDLQTARVQILTCSALLSTSPLQAEEGFAEIVFPPQPTSPNTLDRVECPQGNLPSIMLFDGSSGVFPPTPPNGFTAYVYVNTFDPEQPNAAAEAYIETTVNTAPGSAVLNRIQLGAAGPDTEVVVTDAGVTQLRYYLARREAAS